MTEKYRLKVPGQFAVRGGILDIYPLDRGICLYGSNCGGMKWILIRSFDVESTAFRRKSDGSVHLSGSRVSDVTKKKAYRFLIIFRKRKDNPVSG